MSETRISKRIGVSSNSDIDDDPTMYLDPKHLKMIFPMDVSTKESKNVATKKKISFEKVTASKGHRKKRMKAVSDNWQCFFLCSQHSQIFKGYKVCI